MFGWVTFFVLVSFVVLTGVCGYQAGKNRERARWCRAIATTRIEAERFSPAVLSGAAWALADCYRTSTGDTPPFMSRLTQLADGTRPQDVL